MTHYSKKGSVTYDKTKQWWVATIQIDGKGRSFVSKCKGDCEGWLDIMRNGGNDARYRHKASDTPLEDIATMGGTNPRQVPGFEHYYLCDDGKLFSVKGRLAVIIKPQRGRYLRMSESGNEISVTLERLEYCIANNICPTLLSRCKLSVVRGEAGLQLMDCTDYVKQATRRSHERKWNNIEVFLRENMEWSGHLLAYYSGDTKRLADISKMLEKRREHLQAYIKDTIRVSDNDRIAFISEEVISEMLHRIVNQTALINSPLVYLESLARGINQRIRSVRGKVFCDNNVFHVKGDLSKVDRAKRCCRSHY